MVPVAQSVAVEQIPMALEVECLGTSVLMCMDGVLQLGPAGGDSPTHELALRGVFGADGALIDAVALEEALTPLKEELACKRVLVGEPLGVTFEHRRALASLLFDKLGVFAVAFAPQAVLAFYSHAPGFRKRFDAVSWGMVIHYGEHGVDLVPIFEGFTVLKCHAKVAAGAQGTSSKPDPPPLPKAMLDVAAHVAAHVRQSVDMCPPNIHTDMLHNLICVGAVSNDEMSALGFELGYGAVGYVFGEGGPTDAEARTKDAWVGGSILASTDAAASWWSENTPHVLAGSMLPPLEAAGPEEATARNAAAAEEAPETRFVKAMIGDPFPVNASATVLM